MRPLPSRRMTVPALLATCALTLAACATTGPTPPAANATAPAPRTLTLATGFTIDDLNPLENGFWGPEFGYAELLMRPTAGGDPAPWVLSGLTDPSPQTWVLTLHPGVTFQDGAALDETALAALFTYQLAQNPDLAAALPGATAAATGPLEVTLTTGRPAPNVPALLADESMLPVYDVAAYQKHKATGEPASALVGEGIYTGPYVVDGLDAQSAQLSPRPGYWGGVPTLDHLAIKFVTEASARIQAVEAGEADIALYPPTASAPTLAGRSDAYYVTGQPNGPTFVFEFNQREAPFDDPQVRRAVYAAVDYDELANKVMNKLYAPATGLYSGSRPWAEKTQPTDLAAAGALLDQAGWTRPSPTALRSRDGKELRFTVLTYPQQPDSDTLALAVQAELAAAGIGVDIRQVPDIDGAVQEKTGWQAAISGCSFISFGGDYVTPLVNMLHSGGPSNSTGVADPQLDSLIDRLGTELAAPVRDDLLRQIQHRVADQGYLGYLGIRLPAVVAGPAWRGYPVPISNLWVDAHTAPTAG